MPSNYACRGHGSEYDRANDRSGKPGRSVGRLSASQKDCQRILASAISFPPNPLAHLDLQQLAAGHVRKGAHLMGGSQRLHFAQVVRVELIQARNPEQSHRRYDFAFEDFKNAD